MMQRPPVARVGRIDTQNSFALFGGTNANSSTKHSDTDRPRAASLEVARLTMRLPLSKVMEPLLYSTTPARMWFGRFS